CAVGAALARDPQVTGTLALARERALEGEEVEATVELSARARVDRVDVLLPLPDELQAREGNPRAVRLSPPGPQTVTMPVTCSRWGAVALGPGLLRAHERPGLDACE